MASILVHLTHGPERPLPQAIGYAVTMCLAGNAVQLHVLLRLALESDRMFTY
jgi:hypothetical protein